jgi:16S rRNA (cytidine1402-2'-O)-methyltransferase
MAGILYVIATPIGNLEDITLRALAILKQVDLIAAEDTRHTRILLAHYQIQTPLTSYHEHNEQSRAPLLIERLQRGENLALVTDAGTPAISDPGYRLIAGAIGAGIRIVPVPGPSALLAALSASGMPIDRFVFEGFLPNKRSDRQKKLESLRDEPRTLVFYEAPHRLHESLADMRRIFGEREIAVGRELTKLHEEFVRGSLDDVNLELSGRELKGEITIVARGASGRKEAPSAEQLCSDIDRLAKEGAGIKQIAETLGARYGLPKRQVYRLALQRKDA